MRPITDDALRMFRWTTSKLYSCTADSPMTGNRLARDDCVLPGGVLLCRIPGLKDANPLARPRIVKALQSASPRRVRNVFGSQVLPPPGIFRVNGSLMEIIALVDSRQLCGLWSTDSKIEGLPVAISACGDERS